jgi:hypothetical protein
VLSVVGDVPVDSEASVVTSSILKIYRHSLRICSLGKVCVYSGFNGVCAVSGGDVPVDSETSMVTSSILRICRHSLRRCSLGKFCIRVFVGMSLRAL